MLLIGLLFADTNSAKSYSEAIRRPKTDMLLIRTDDERHVLWTKIFSFGHITQCDVVASTRHDGFVLAGWADSCVVGSRRGLWMIVTDNNGTPLWDHCFAPDPKLSYAFSASLIQLADGRIVVAGPKSPSRQAWMFCVSEKGDLLWSRIYDTGECRALVSSPDGGFVLVGNWKQAAATYGEHSTSDGWILKTDDIGQQQWLQTFGGEYWDGFYDATVTANNGIIAVGESFSDNQPETKQPDGWALIVDSAGNLIRNQIYGQSIGMQFFNVQVAPDGGFLLFGGATWPKVQPWESSDRLLMKISENGDSLWSRFKKDGWEEADSCITEDSEKLPYGYLDRALRTDTPHHIGVGQLVSKFGGAFEWLRTNGYTGRVLYGGSGVCTGGYFFAGSIEPSESKESMKSQEGHDDPNLFR